MTDIESGDVITAILMSQILNQITGNILPASPITGEYENGVHNLGSYDYRYGDIFSRKINLSTQHSPPSLSAIDDGVMAHLGVYANADGIQYFYMAFNDAGIGTGYQSSKILSISNETGNVTIGHIGGGDAKLDVRGSLRVGGGGYWDSILIQHQYPGVGESHDGIMNIKPSVHSVSGTAEHLTRFSSASNDTGATNHNVQVDGKLYASEITCAGNVTAGGSFVNSDYRLKENVVPLDNALERVKSVDVYRFNYIGAPDTTVDGFLAHEVQEVVPESVTGQKDGMKDTRVLKEKAKGEIFIPAKEAMGPEDTDTPEKIIQQGVEKPEELPDGQEWREIVEAVYDTVQVPDMQTLDQSKLVPLLFKAVQELSAKVSALEANN